MSREKKKEIDVPKKFDLVNEETSFVKKLNCSKNLKKVISSPFFNLEYILEEPCVVPR